MADRTSAALFGKIFGLLARNPTAEHKSIAMEMWREAKEYDFSPYQMSADDDLIKLGLARVQIDPENPKEGEVIFYEGEK